MQQQTIDNLELLSPTFPIPQFEPLFISRCTPFPVRKYNKEEYFPRVWESLFPGVHKVSRNLGPTVKIVRPIRVIFSPFPTDAPQA